MDTVWYFKLIFLFAAFLFSAFFSGSEVALFSLDKKKLRADLGKNPIIERYLTFLLEHPRRLLVTILIGNTVVNVAASIVAVSLALDYAAFFKVSQNIVLSIQIVLLTVLIVIFGELIPKVWASKNPVSFSKGVAVPLYWISALLFPVAEVFTEMIKLSVSKLKFDKSKTAILPEELEELADIGHEMGSIIEEEHGLISGIVGFRSVAVHEVMTPRVDMISVPSDAGFDELLGIITSSGHSRIPLYHGNLDTIIGILYAKDVLPYVKNESLRQQLSLAKISRKALFIPRTKMIFDLMHEFQEKKMHIAIVVDEYGGTAGLITLEDILEEIIGEIRDEYDKEENLVTKISENGYIVLGKMPVDELGEVLNVNLQTEDSDFETIGGLVLNYAGHIPKEGYSFQLENHKFTVKEVSNKRIKKVLVEKTQAE